MKWNISQVYIYHEQNIFDHPGHFSQIYCITFLTAKLNFQQEFLIQQKHICACNPGRAERRDLLSVVINIIKQMLFWIWNIPFKTPRSEVMESPRKAQPPFAFVCFSCGRVCNSLKARLWSNCTLSPVIGSCVRESRAADPSYHYRRPEELLPCRLGERRESLGVKRAVASVYFVPPVISWIIYCQSANASW